MRLFTDLNARRFTPIVEVQLNVDRNWNSSIFIDFSFDETRQREYYKAPLQVTVER